MTWNWTSPVLTAGTHTIKVSAKDAWGHKTPDKVITVYGTGAIPADKSGIEPWMQYQDFPTGADSVAKVNVGTGNLVWRADLFDAPGRGLSTRGWLTFNSTERLNRLVDQYTQAGIGMSLGISSLTRLNEPLGVKTTDPTGRTGFISLIDSDGTKHDFYADGGNLGAFKAPAGVRGIYVGQSGNINERFLTHLIENGGRFTREELNLADRFQVLGGRTAREIAEQRKIDELGGVGSLLNVRNPIGRRRMHLMPQPYSRP
jgi:hypothetical protein